MSSLLWRRNSELTLSKFHIQFCGDHAREISRTFSNIPPHVQELGKMGRWGGKEGKASDKEEVLYFLLGKIMKKPRRKFNWLFIGIGNGEVVVKRQRTKKAK